MDIKQIIENNTTVPGLVFDLVIQGLIVLSLVAFSIDTLPTLSAETRDLLRAIEVSTVAVFTLEYLLRLLVADRKVHFVFSFYAVIDLLAILPFYLSTGLDLRSLRAFRLLRLFRAFKLLRYSKAIRRFRKAFIMVKEELVLFAVTASIVFYLAGAGIYLFENEAQPEVFTSIFTSLWWSVCTLTTVGYGDICPLTAGGRVFTFFVLMIGLGVVAVPTGLVASALSKAREDERP